VLFHVKTGINEQNFLEISTFDTYFVGGKVEVIIIMKNDVAIFLYKKQVLFDGSKGFRFKCIDTFFCIIDGFIYKNHMTIFGEYIFTFYILL